MMHIYIHILLQVSENMNCLYVYYRRSWFKTSASQPLKTTISTAYMDAAGVGKIITISQALFEGMIPRKKGECDNMTTPLPGGCPCKEGEDCISGQC